MPARTGAPAYALPPTDKSNQSYSAEVREWLTDYEKSYGPRGPVT